MHRILLALCVLSLVGAHAAEDFADWKFLRTIGPEELRHAGVVNSIRFSPDGKTLLSASSDGTARLWDSATGREIRRFKTGNAEVMAAEFGPDGESVFTAGRDGLVRMYHLASGAQLRAFACEQYPALLTFLPGTSTLLCCGLRSAKLYDTQTTEERPLTLGSQYSALFSPGNSRLIVGQKGSLPASTWGWNVIAIHELKNGPAVCNIHAKEPINSMTLSPNGRELAVALKNGVDVFDTSNGGQLRGFRDEKHSFRQIQYLPNSDEIAGVGVNRLSIFNAQSGVVHKTIQTPRIWSRTLSLSPDGATAAIGGWDNTIHLIDLERGAPRLPGAGHTDAIASVDISPDGTLAASGSEDGTVRLWEFSSGRELQTIDPKADDVMGVQFSADGKRVFAAGGVGTPDDRRTQSWLKAWNVADGSAAGAWLGGEDSNRANGLAIVSANSVAVCERGALRVWNTEKNQFRLLKCPGWEMAAASAGGGRWMLSGDGGYSGEFENEFVLRLWDTATGRQLNVYKGLAREELGAARCIRVAPDQTSALVAYSSVMGAPGPLTLLRFPRSSATSSVNSSDSEKPPDAAAQEPVQAWIAKLSSDSFDVRAEAARRLTALGPRAQEFLKRAENSPDAETRASIHSILAQIELSELPVMQGMGGIGAALNIEGAAEAVAYHPDSRHWAAVIENRGAREIVFGEISEDRASMKILRRIPADRNPGTLVFSPDGNSLLTGNADTTLSVYGR